jgi:hypothetical protein
MIMTEEEVEASIDRQIGREARERLDKALKDAFARTEASVPADKIHAVATAVGVVNMAVFPKMMVDVAAYKVFSGASDLRGSELGLYVWGTALKTLGDAFTSAANELGKTPDPEKAA